jgi:hypothetical protein
MGFLNREGLTTDETKACHSEEPRAELVLSLSKEGIWVCISLLLFSIFSRGPGVVDHLTLQKKGFGGI